MFGGCSSLVSCPAGCARIHVKLRVVAPACASLNQVVMSRSRWLARCCDQVAVKLRSRWRHVVGYSKEGIVAWGWGSSLRAEVGAYFEGGVYVAR